MEIKPFLSKRPKLEEKLKLLAQQNDVDYNTWLMWVEVLFESVQPEQCTEAMLERYLIYIAASGADPNPAAGHINLVPRKMRVAGGAFKTMIRIEEGYKFILHLLSKAGFQVYTQVVKQGECCKVRTQGGQVEIEHEFDLASRDKVIVASYAIAQSINNPNLRYVAVVDAQEMSRIKAEAIASDSMAWKKGPEAMAKKAAVHRIRHMLPLNTMLAILEDDVQLDAPDQKVTTSELNELYAKLGMSISEIEAIEAKFNDNNELIFNHLTNELHKLQPATNAERVSA